MKPLDCSAPGLWRACCASVVVMTLLLPGRGFANDAGYNVDEPGFRDVAAEYMADYFSDPRRTGSLAGGIIGGALTAHPIGPVIGGIVGFLIGKRSIFSEEEDRRLSRRAGRELAQRPIAPTDGSSSGVGTLSLSGAAQSVSVAPVVQPEPVLAVATAPATLIGSAAPVSPSVPLPPADLSAQTALAVPVDVVAFQSVPALPPVAHKPIVSNEQLTSLCAQGALQDPRLRAMCYYGQSN